MIEQDQAAAVAASPARAFWREFRKSPKELGTCFVSSKALSRAVTSDMGLENAKIVVELGAGSGALTEQVLAKVPAACRFFAIELNLGLARALKARFPRVRVYREDAANVRSICEREGIVPGTVDAVVSSLPFLLMPDGVRGSILHEVQAVLRPGGKFAMLTYRPEKLMPSVKKFRAQMEAEFRPEKVRMARWVPWNIPPAFIYRCEK